MQWNRRASRRTKTPHRQLRFNHSWANRSPRSCPGQRVGNRDGCRHGRSLSDAEYVDNFARYREPLCAGTRSKRACSM